MVSVDLVLLPNDPDSLPFPCCQLSHLPVHPPSLPTPRSQIQMLILPQLSKSKTPAHSFCCDSVWDRSLGGPHLLPAGSTPGLGAALVKALVQPWGGSYLSLRSIGAL